MTRYIAKPVKFWVVHTLALPILSIWVLLIPVYFFVVLMPGGLGEPFDGGLVFAYFLGMTVAGYFIGAGIAAVYSALLALWQWRRGGHTFLEAMLFAWTILALVGIGMTLAGDDSLQFLVHATIAAAVAMPILWLMCRLLGIIYRHDVHITKASV